LGEWINGGRWESRIEGGESFSEIRERFVPFVEELVEAHRGSSRGIVLIGHGGLYRCMLPLVLANVDQDLAMGRPLGNTGYVEAELAGDQLVFVERVD
jgi:probable phosphoglycerate mutase